MLMYILVSDGRRVPALIASDNKVDDTFFTKLVTSLGVDDVAIGDATVTCAVVRDTSPIELATSTAMMTGVPAGKYDVVDDPLDNDPLPMVRSVATVVVTGEPLEDDVVVVLLSNLNV